MKKICLILVWGVLVNVTNMQNLDKAQVGNVFTPNGYHFSYKTDDSERTEKGVLDESKGESGIIIVSGSYNFVGTDGRRYGVDYIADENGYRPVIKSEYNPGLTPKTKQTAPGFLTPYVGSGILGSLVGGGLG